MPQLFGAFNVAGMRSVVFGASVPGPWQSECSVTPNAMQHPDLRDTAIENNV